MIDPTWPTELLRESLAERGVELVTPREHRDRWLETILAGAMRFRIGLGRDVQSADFVESGLDVAAGVLIELPRLEADGWSGWNDPRMASVLTLLRMAELSESPPWAGLADCWRELRDSVPFELATPRPGDFARPVESFVEEVVDYLHRVTEEVEAVLGCGVDPAVATSAPPHLPRRLLGDRLRAEVARHGARVHGRVLPLARDLYWAAFPAQRSATLMSRGRGDHDRLEEGRPLRVRSKQRYHLAAWVLQQAGLTRVECGLFLHHVDPSGLQSALPQTEDETWKARLEGEVDNSLAYWKTGPGARGAEPVVQVGQIEFELKDLLRPVRG